MIADIPIDNQMTPDAISYYETLSEYEVNGEPLGLCILRAARKLDVHADYIYTIAIAEGGESGKYSKNADGTHDMGVMQINYERWWHEIKKIGYQVDWRKVLKQTCSNVLVGGIIYRHRAKPAKGAYEAISNYHWYSMVKNKAPHLRYKARIVPIYEDIVRDRETFQKTGELNIRLRCKYAHCD
ncbi:transglycosylase SLT domain protein [Vibrio tubiashii]|uniref:transglycosylase SLT domain protein n=1 Tax=Vibrio tubiashii TaxID=29498 RepID=UPI001EFD4EA7|nr:transglycosylase SLT domain protein [Vibrio tubiashii]MCG9579571.1 transglycosylase SLT domain protein [Vibrio tubiashii]